MNISTLRHSGSAGGELSAYHCNIRTAFHVHRSQLQRNGRDLSIFAESVDAPQEQAPADVDSVPPVLGDSSKPRSCGAAIDLGLERFQEGKFDEAIDMFTLALELPGNGFMRVAGTTREYACPSDAEEEAALYNMACCYSQLEEREPGMTVLQGLLENGFERFDELRNDSDLAFLRADPQFSALVDQFEKPQGLFGRRPSTRRSTERKGWLSRW